jgi:dolichol-phosphate mannosyltransferase
MALPKAYTMTLDSISGASNPSPASASAPRPALLAIIVPTFNERENVHEMVARLDSALAGIDWEVVFVDDDSTDGTRDILRDLARSDARVRFLHRIGRRGLASAVVEGIQSTSSPYVAVIDGDLQHDERLLPEMFARVRSSHCDVVVGSRYIESGGLDRLDKRRRLISRVATGLAQLLMGARLSDPMSGYFLITRDAFDRSVRRLSNLGYKILLDILLSAKPSLTVVELPYVFRNRVHGESKLDSAVTLEYLMLLLDKIVGGFVPVRFVMFMLVGSLGVLVHMLALAVLNQVLDFSFVTGQTTAAITAMTFNFFANNALTYRDKRLKGARQLLGGLLSFYVICAIGAVSNVGIAAFLFLREYSWWLSGLAGILVGAVWNYAASSIFTWRK